MPYPIEQLLEGKGPLIYVTKEDTVAYALSLMIEHDFSQLPVVEIDEYGAKIPLGLITSESILRGVKNLKSSIEELSILDVMINAYVDKEGEDLFDILDRLNNTNAVLIERAMEPGLLGIVTSYDTTEYFRNRAEDLMRIQEIEFTIKDFIKIFYQSKDGEFKKEALTEAIMEVNPRYKPDQGRDFNNLSMGVYINLLTLEGTWPFYKPLFNKTRESVKALLDGVRKTRNILAHFEREITPDERDGIKFAFDWISRRFSEYQEWNRDINYKELFFKTLEEERKFRSIGTSITDTEAQDDSLNTFSFFTPAETVASKSRYSALADWLQSQPGRNNNIPLTFNQIEEIIGSNLPDSARTFRAWWANDSVGHSHSQLWLDAGWRTTYINLSEGRITFSRIREREKAYIDFFGNLLVDLRRYVNFPIRDISPDGASWIVIQKAPRLGQTFAHYAISFSRTRKLRIELYIDLLEKDQTKLVFDKLLEKKTVFEAQLGPLEWERLDNRRASRIALYKDGHVTEEEKLPELRKWAVDTMYKFYNATIEDTEAAIREVKQ